MKRLHVRALLAGCATLAAVGTASGGGYSLGTADTDIIFDEGNFNMRASVTIVMPQRGYETLTVPGTSATVAGTDGTYAQSYAIPSSAIKFNLTDDLRCAGTYTQPFGADSEFGPQAILFGAMADGTGTVKEGFETNEFGASCGYKFDLAKGRAWIVVGGFVQDFSYSQTVEFAAPVPGLGESQATLQFDGDYEPGFRIGAAYEIPEIGLRAQIMYRSQVTHNPDGTFSTVLDGVDPDGPGPAPTYTDGTAVGLGTLPQSVELKLQSGFAPGWLAFGAVKWTDWSVLDTLDYTVFGGPLPGARELEYYYKDGWTVTAGIGHAFNETVSGAISLMWDRGVSTTEDVLSDSYTAIAGVAFKDKLGGEVRFGGAIGYQAAASVSAETGQDVGVYNPGASFGYSVGGDWMYGLTAGYRIAW